jgi:hypothetical protein
VRVRGLVVLAINKHIYTQNERTARVLSALPALLPAVICRELPEAKLKEKGYKAIFCSFSSKFQEKSGFITESAFFRTETDGFK